MIEVIKLADLADIDTDQGLLEQISQLMTPEDILEQTEFEEAEAIYPPLYPTFDELKKHAERIRRLKLLPVKEDQAHLYYNQLSKERLLEEVNLYLTDSPITLAVNRFPYWLPEDLEQYLIWSHSQVGREQVIEFSAKAIKYLGVNPEHVIMFERPQNIQTRLVKGTFPSVNHVHFWIKRSGQISK